jgi:hypothetical protein
MKTAILAGAIIALASAEPARAQQIDDHSVFSVHLLAVPGPSDAQTEQMMIQLGDSEIDGFAVISEPSHTLLGVALNSNRAPDWLERTNWWQEEIEPLLGHATRISFTRMRTPLGVGASLTFSYSKRPQNDTQFRISVFGDSLLAYSGSRVAHGTLEVPKLFNVILRMGPLDSFLCQCVGGGGCTNSSVTCTKPWDQCSCCFSTTEECGQCGKVTASCAPCPFC